MKRLIFVLLALLFALALACGSDATPQRTGSVSEDPPTEAPAAAEEEKAPTEEEVAPPTTEEEPTAVAEADTPTPEPTQGPTTFEIGDIVEIGDSVLVVLGWENVEPNDFAKPEAGNKFMAVDLLIVNQGSDSASISSLLQTELKDAESRRYQADLMAGTVVGSGGIDGELAPGERVRGKVAFQVPEAAQGLQFGFDAEVFGTGKVTVNLPAEPVAMEPPAEIAGESDQELAAIGDVVEIGDIAITVNEVKEFPGNDFAKPEEGKKFLAVDVTIENKSSAAAAISTALQMKLKDAGGQQYQVDFLAQTASGGATVDGELAPGEKVRGDVAFQVPVDATGLQFEFDATVFGLGKALVDLGM